MVTQVGVAAEVCPEHAHWTVMIPTQYGSTCTLEIKIIKTYSSSQQMLLNVHTHAKMTTLCVVMYQVRINAVVNMVILVLVKVKTIAPVRLQINTRSLVMKFLLYFAAHPIMLF